MKKLLFLFVCCLFLCGCANSEEKEVLIGEWSYDENTGRNWGNIYKYEFLDNNSVKYFECIDMTLDNGCISGSAVWIGKYSLDKNIIKLSDFEIDKGDSYNYSEILNGPSDKLIVDFDYMYLCDRDSGLNCLEKFTKDTNE